MQTYFLFATTGDCCWPLERMFKALSHWHLGFSPGFPIHLYHLKKKTTLHRRRSALVKTVAHLEPILFPHSTRYILSCDNLKYRTQPQCHIKRLRVRRLRQASNYSEHKLQFFSPIFSLFFTIFPSPPAVHILHPFSALTGSKKKKKVLSNAVGWSVSVVNSLISTRPSPPPEPPRAMRTDTSHFERADICHYVVSSTHLPVRLEESDWFQWVWGGQRVKALGRANVRKWCALRQGREKQTVCCRELMVREVEEEMSEGTCDGWKMFNIEKRETCLPALCTRFQ